MAYTKTKYLNTFFKVEKKTHNTDIALKTRGHFMTNMMDDIAHLSQEIGPRPAGTEEEQQAALYIADELQKSAGFSTIVEDVSCASNGNTVRAICFGLAFVCALLPIIFPVLSIPCFIIGLLAAALFACEVFGKPVLSRCKIQSAFYHEHQQASQDHSRYALRQCARRNRIPRYHRPLSADYSQCVCYYVGSCAPRTSYQDRVLCQ